VVVAGVV
jgi:hypothetical protein